MQVTTKCREKTEEVTKKPRNFAWMFRGFLSLKYSLCSQCATNQESRSQSYDSVKFGEYGENQRIAEYVVSLADSGDTVGANLSLTDSGEQRDQSQRKIAAA